MKLPNSDSAVADLRKLEQYSLNPAHESGGHKARVFRAALGLTRNDAAWLKVQVLNIAREGHAIEVKPSPFGRKYVVDANLTRHTQTAIVRTVWIIENGTDFPRLISCYVK